MTKFEPQSSDSFQIGHMHHSTGNYEGSKLKILGFESRDFVLEKTLISFTCS